MKINKESFIKQKLIEDKILYLHCVLVKFVG